MPPSPPPSVISLGKVRRNPRKGIVYVAVDVADSGHFVVRTTTGLSWTFAGEGVGPALSGGGRKWLRIQPAGSGWDAHNMRRRLRNRGRVRIGVSIQFSEVMKATTTVSRSLLLVRKRPKRR